MNNYAVLQRTQTERWYYTRNLTPTGYCAEHEEGHATKEEAVACYTRYLLDTRTRYDGKASNQQRKCEVCGEWTDRFADVGFNKIIFLCDAHRNREELEKVYKAPEWSTSSW